MSEFKIGDIVKYIGSRENGEYSKGVVINISSPALEWRQPIVTVLFDHTPLTKNCYPINLKKITLKVGDRVIFNLDGTKQKAEITSITYPLVGHDLYYGVKCDNKFLFCGLLPAYKCKKLVKKKKEFKVVDRVRTDAGKGSVIHVCEFCIKIQYDVCNAAKAVCGINHGSLKKLKPKKKEKKFNIGDRVILNMASKGTILSKDKNILGTYYYGIVFDKFPGITLMHTAKNLSLYKEPFKITGPGIYQQQDGRVVHIKNMRTYGVYVCWEGMLYDSEIPVLPFLSDFDGIWSPDGTCPIDVKYPELGFSNARKLVKRLDDLPGQTKIKDYFRIIKNNIATARRENAFGVIPGNNMIEGYLRSSMNICNEVLNEI